jgi:uncharacterized protein (DUF1330 family)
MQNSTPITGEPAPINAVFSPSTAQHGAGPAFIIGHITVKDADKWAEYCRRVPATVEPWGGTLLCRGTGAEALCGEHAFTDSVVIRFPDLASITGWHESAAYQALLPIRHQAADVVIVSYQE